MGTLREVELEANKFTWDAENNRTHINCPICGADLSSAFTEGGTPCECYLGQMAEGEIEHTKISEGEFDTYLDKFSTLDEGEMRDRMKPFFTEKRIESVFRDINYWKKYEREEPYSWHCGDRMDLFTLMLAEKESHAVVCYFYDAAGRGGTLLFTDKDNALGNLTDTDILERAKKTPHKS